MKNIFFSIVVLAFFPMQIIAQGNLPAWIQTYHRGR